MRRDARNCHEYSKMLLWLVSSILIQQGKKPQKLDIVSLIVGSAVSLKLPPLVINEPGILKPFFVSGVAAEANPAGDLLICQVFYFQNIHS